MALPFSLVRPAGRIHFILCMPEVPRMCLGLLSDRAVCGKASPQVRDPGCSCPEIPRRNPGPEHQSAFTVSELPRGGVNN